MQPAGAWYVYNDYVLFWSTTLLPIFEGPMLKKGVKSEEGGRSKDKGVEVLRPAKGSL